MPDSPTADPRLIYFAKRNPRLSVPEFRDRWRRHGALAMALPRWKNMARYEQCDTVDIGLPPQSTLLCDGVAVLTYRDEPARQRHVADIVGQSIMEDDEREIFSALVKEFAVLTDLTIQRGEPPASGLTVFVLTSPNDSGERARMDDFCQGTVQRWGNHAAWRSCIPRGKPAPTAIDSDRIDILSGDVSVSVVRDTCDGLTALTFAKGPQPKLLVTSIHLQFP